MGRYFYLLLAALCMVAMWVLVSVPVHAEPYEAQWVNASHADAAWAVLETDGERGEPVAVDCRAGETCWTTFDRPPGTHLTRVLSSVDNFTYDHGSPARITFDPDVSFPTDCDPNGEGGWPVDGEGLVVVYVVKAGLLCGGVTEVDELPNQSFISPTPTELTPYPDPPLVPID